MPRFTITVSEETNEFLEEHTGEDGEFSSKSAAAAHYIERGREADAIEQELEIVENKLEEARQQMKHREHVEEKVDLLAKRVEEQQRTGNAPFPVRWYRWWRTRGETETNEA